MDPTPTVTYLLRLTTNDERLDYTDPYIDVVWTPILGPCAISLLRALAHTTRTQPNNPTATTTELAALVGVSPRLVHKAIRRLADTDLITVNNHTITLGNGLPTAPSRRLSTLPPTANTYALNRHRTLERNG